jgi:hypothetical protein
MPTSLHVPLPDLALCRDPFVVSFRDLAKLASANSAFTELELEVQVEEVFGSNEFHTVGEILNPYDLDDLAKANINRPLLGRLQALPPDLSATGVQFVPDVVKRFRLRARDVVGGVPQGDFNASPIASAWLAGRSYLDFDLDYITGKAYLFMSSLPLNRRFHPSEKLFFYVLPVVSGSATLKAEITYTDGSSTVQNTSLGAVSIFRPFYINYNFPASSKTVAKVDFSITGLSGTAEKLNYQAIPNPGPYFRQLIYLNSLGGYDSFPLLGKAETTNTEAGEVFEGQLFPASASQFGNYQTFNQRSFISHTLRSGWIPLAERDALNDMLLRNEVYLLQANRLVKLLIANATHQRSKDGEFLYSLEFNARQAFDNYSYSKA